MYSCRRVTSARLTDLEEERRESGTLQAKFGLRASEELIASGAVGRSLLQICMSATKTISAPVQSAVVELIGELHAKSGGEKFGITCEAFAAILCDVIAIARPRSER